MPRRSSALIPFVEALSVSPKNAIAAL